MVDRRRIVRQWRQGGAKVLATLVRVEGSSYRQPGAHLLIGSDGEYAGTISGGCLEAEVVRKAEWMVRDGAVVQRYSTMFDDTAEMPFGLGCGGVVDLLLEPAQTPECHAFLAAMETSLSGNESLVATWLPQDGSSLARVVMRGGKPVFASSGLDTHEIALASVTDSFLSSGLLDGRIYLEKIRAPQRLIVLGAGDDAKPVVTMAALLGWNITVADGRAQLTRPERFPEAERVLTASSVEDLGIKRGDAVVLMTHSYEQDRALLAELLKADSATTTTPGYIGLLGARHRSSLLVSQAAEMAGRSVAECCESVFSPVGLDLGGDGAEAIALAVVAEVQAWVQGRQGRSRRLTAQDVAEQIAQLGTSRNLQAQCALDAAGN